MRYLSICSGIESATVAWHPLGWEPVAFAEIDPFPSAVLHNHYGSGRPLRMPDPDAPDLDLKERRRRRAAIKGVSYLPETPAPNGVPNLGDFTQIQSSDLRSDIDLLVGGTPCQDFSVAGLRAGLDGDRGNLSLEFLRLAQRTRPRWLVWENVPGVLSSNGGRDFGAILGGMVELGYGFAYRVLDAQYIRVDGYARAVPQRRRRVFVVGHLGDWRRAAAVLFERACLSGHPAPRREAGEGVAGTLAARSGGGGHPDGGDGRHSQLIASATEFLPQSSRVYFEGEPAPALQSSGDRLGNRSPQILAFGGNNTESAIDVATACRAKGGTGHGDFESETFIASLANGNDVAGTLQNAGKAAGTGTVQDAYASLLLPVAFDTTQITSGENRCNPQPGDPCHPIPAHGHAPAVAFHASQDPDVSGDIAHPLGNQHNGMTNGVLENWRVRRLTPTECERLMGFPDGYTAITYRGKPAADGPRYKALGNSMACNVMRWIGLRIAMVEEITSREAA